MEVGTRIESQDEHTSNGMWRRFLLQLIQLGRTGYRTIGLELMRSINLKTITVMIDPQTVINKEG